MYHGTRAYGGPPPRNERIGCMRRFGIELIGSVFLTTLAVSCGGDDAVTSAGGTDTDSGRPTSDVRRSTAAVACCELGLGL